MSTRFFDLDAALVALEGYGYERDVEDPSRYYGPFGVVAEIRQELGGEVEVLVFLVESRQAAA